MKILMNPPYDKNLHLKILREAMKHSDEIVNLSPIEFLYRPFAKPTWQAWKDEFRDDFSGKFDVPEIISIEEASKQFSIGIEAALGIWHFSPDVTPIDYDNWYKEMSKDELATIEKFRTKTSLKEHLVKFDKQKYFVPLRKDAIMERWWKYQLINYLDMLVDGKVYSGDYKGKTVLEARQANPHENHRNDDRPTFGIAFDTFEEAKNFRDSVKTKAYIYIISRLKKSRTFPLSKLPYLDDYKEAWSDERLCKHFNLTPEEVDIIEKEIQMPRKLTDFGKIL